MDNERNLGVTEARFGLTLLICLLVAIGYVLLLRLGSPGETTIEVGIAVEPPHSTPHDETDVQPQVLKVEPEEMAMRTSPRSGRQGTASREDVTPPTQNQAPIEPTDSKRR